ncbi:MAG: glycosyltransferase family 4 protein [Ignavibacterium sp.]|nr:MAG: glycosyltransferase family 4 protein [Ignavibacterium sp.]
MKIGYINHYYDIDTLVDNYLSRYPTIYGWCKSLRDLGLDVNVYQRFSKDYFFEKEGVKYCLIKDGKRSDLKSYQNSSLFHSKISDDKYDIIHVNSFIYSYQAFLLKKRNSSSKIVIQHHAEIPHKRLKRFFLKHLSSSADGFIFTSNDIYNDWVKTNSVFSGKNVAEIMESSSNFTYSNRIKARSKSGMVGEPILLWVGRLNENKDPITVIKGFSKLLQDFPKAKLYMIYSEDKLKEQVSSIINQSGSLKNSVKLLGFINHIKLDDYYNSADYFVLGSHYEGSGYSLVEAMSCGVVPIVTNIPSFRMITNNGQIGGLWNCGDIKSFYGTAKRVFNSPLAVESKKALDFFSANVSYPAIGMKAKKFYETLTDK